MTRLLSTELLGALCGLSPRSLRFKA